MTIVARTRQELSTGRRQLLASRTDAAVAVVMTMGALHAGHVELVRRARQRAGSVIVTEFLNPLQFAPGEDLDKYPRTFESDLAVCRAEGVDLLFAPDAAGVYPGGQPLVRVSAGPVGDTLEGDRRPGHFDGVLTVVAKLLHLTEPDLAYFGRKDAQQLWLIQRLVDDLDFDVEIVAVPTVRDTDGLALSSRNAYLSPDDRRCALVLSRALRDAERLAARSATTAETVLDLTRTTMRAESGVSIDYVELVDPETFRPVAAAFVGDALLLVAAKVGTTRLIDNTVISLTEGRH
jgi:pantoate--beta-alanine ligase